MTLRRYSGVGDDVDPLVVGDGHQVVLDEVAAGSEHRVAIGLEGGVEVGRLVGLDPVDDRRLVGVGVDLAGGRGACLALLARAAPSRARGSRRRRGRRRRAGRPSRRAARGRSPSRRCRRRACPRATSAYSSTAILADSLGALEAALLGRRQDADAGRDELVEERRQLARGLDLDPLPAPDLRDGRPGLGFLEVGRGGLEPAGDGVESLGERGVVAGEQQEQAVADVCRGRTSGAPRVAARRCRRSRGGRCGSRGRARSEPSATGAAGSIASTAARWSRSVGELGRGRPRGCRRRAGRRRAWRPSAVPSTGLSRTSRTKRVSTRS